MDETHELTKGAAKAIFKLYQLVTHGFLSSELRFSVRNLFFGHDNKDHILHGKDFRFGVMSMSIGRSPFNNQSYCFNRGSCHPHSSKRHNFNQSTILSKAYTNQSDPNVRSAQPKDAHQGVQQAAPGASIAPVSTAARAVHSNQAHSVNVVLFLFCIEYLVAH
ncbi:hypothetical protein Tco_0700247 [Tanacetum coccineum]